MYDIEDQFPVSETPMDDSVCHSRPSGISDCYNGLMLRGYAVFGPPGVLSFF